MAPDTKPARQASTLASIVLGCLVLAVFWPILGFEFIDYDVSIGIIRNPHIRGLSLENVKHIFTSRCITSYYPIRTLTYAADYQLWGLNAGGFKLTNALIHLANVLLVYWLILRMFRRLRSADATLRPRWDIPAAAFSAGVFAIHPLVVEPVAWVAGREELLMTLGALGCLHLHITARRLEHAGGKTGQTAACYAGAAACCAAACLSNAVAAIIPALIVTYDALTLPSPKLRRILVATAALWLIAAATLAIKKFGEPAVLLGESGTFTSARAMLILEVYGKNLKAILWPTDLAFFYSPTTPKTFLETRVLWGGVAIGLTMAILWGSRRNKLLLLGLAWFILTLAPTSQVMPHHIHAADRYLYLPLVGLVMAVATGLALLCQTVQSGAGRAAIGVAGVSILLLAGAKSVSQVQTWQKNVTVWENCLRVDPENSLAHSALADNLTARGDLTEAAKHREAQMRLDFDNEAVMRVAAQWASVGSPDKPPDHRLAIQLAKRACELSRWQDTESLGVLAAVYSRHAQFLVESGKLGPGAEEYSKALQADPDCQIAMFQLAVILATCSDEKLRRPEQAVQLAERACALTDPPDYRGAAILAVAYAEALQFDAAVATTEQVIKLARLAGDDALANAFQGRLESYRRRIPPQALRP